MAAPEWRPIVLCIDVDCLTGYLDDGRYFFVAD